MRATASMIVALLAAGCAPSNGTVDVPGPVRSFDPVAALPQVQAFVGGGAKLVSLKAVHVRGDGTVDLEAPYHQDDPITYRFVRPSRAVPDPNVPIGARGKVLPFEAIVVHVTRPHTVYVTCSGGRGRCEWRHQGMRSYGPYGAESESVPPAPGCGLRSLWSEANRRGAPANAVATIVYTKDGFDFAIPDTPTALHFDSECHAR
jgi:hypothetical protein